MSQAAAAMLMNPSSVPQEASVSASRTGRTNTSAKPDKLLDSKGGHPTSGNESPSRPESKLFKDVLEKRLPIDTQKLAVSSEISGEEKSEKKKTKTTIQDLSNIALLSMNPAFVQGERKIQIPLSVQGGQSGASSAKGSVQPILSSAQVQGRSQVQYQAGAKELKGRESTQFSQMPQYSTAVNGKDTKDVKKTDKATGETQVSGTPGAEAERMAAGRKQQSPQTLESASSIATSGLGNPNLTPKVNPGGSVKIDSQASSGPKTREGSRRGHEELPIQNEGKTSKKQDKTKTPSQVPDSQNENGGQQPVQSDGVLSFSQSQYNVKQANMAAGRADSVTNAVSTIDNGPVHQSPGRQVAEAIREQLAMPAPQSEIQMILNPPELGKIRIVFQQNNQEVTGLLEVEKLRTRADIQKELPQVLLSLQNAGVQIRRLEVVMDNPNNSPSPDQQPGNQPFPDSFLDRPDQYFASDSRQGQGSSGSQGSLRDFQSTQTPDNADQKNSFIRDDAINVYL